MSEKRVVPRKAGSPLSLRQLVPSGWHEDRPAFAGDPFFDWESKPEPPGNPRELRIIDRPRTDHRSHA